MTVTFVGPTPNRWPGALNDLRYRVDHDTESASLAGVIAWFQNPAAYVSAQLIVDRDGAIYQMADLRDACWHAGITYAPSTPLYDGTNPNLVAVGVEFILDHYTTPLTAAQLAASPVIDDLIRKTFGVSTVPHVPHSALATGGPDMRRDPGDANFAAILAAMQEGDDLFTDADRQLAKDIYDKVNALATNIPFVWLERLAKGQDPATGLPLALPPKHLAALSRAATEAQKAVKGMQDHSQVQAPAPGMAAGQKGVWPGPGPEPVAPERAAAKKMVRKTRPASSGRKGGG